MIPCFRVPRSPALPRWARARILFLASSTTLAGFDAQFRDLLVAHGATVTVAVGSDANFSANIAGKDLFIISNTAGTPTYGATAQASTVPGIVWRNQAWPTTNCGWTTSNGTSSGTTLDFSVPGHPIANTGGTANSTAIAGVNVSRNHGVNLEAGVTNIARGAGRSSAETVLCALEAGAAIDILVNGGVCPARRVGIGLQSTSLNDRALQLHVQAVNWALGLA